MRTQEGRIQLNSIPNPQLYFENQINEQTQRFHKLSGRVKLSILGDSGADTWQTLGSAILVLRTVKYNATTETSAFLVLNGICLNNRHLLKGNIRSAKTRPTEAGLCS